MRAVLFVVAVVAVALAGTSLYMGGHPELMAAKTGFAPLDETNRIAARFGQAGALMVVVRANEGTLVDAAPLQEFEALQKTFSRSGLCKSALSFFALPQMVVGEEETEIRNLVEKLPANDAERTALKQRILAHPNAVGDLVAPDLTRALLICPLLDDAKAEAIDALVATKTTALTLTRAGPQALGKALARDFLISALWFLLAAGVAVLFAPFLERQRRLVLIVVAQIAIVVLARPLIFPRGDALSMILGSEFARVQGELDAVTGASQLLLIELNGDFTSAKTVRDVADGCAKLGKKVSCPTDVLITMSGALTGETTLPATDEQLKALWFFAGDRPELSLIATPDKRAMLARVRLAAGDDSHAMEHQAEDAFAAHAPVVAGLPVVNRWITAHRTLALSVLLVVFALAFVLGRRSRFEAVALGEALLVPALLVKVGLVAFLLVLLGGAVLFATVGARSKRLAS